MGVLQITVARQLGVGAYTGSLVAFSIIFFFFTAVMRSMNVLVGIFIAIFAGLIILIAQFVYPAYLLWHAVGLTQLGSVQTGQLMLAAGVAMPARKQEQVHPSACVSLVNLPGPWGGPSRNIRLPTALLAVWLVLAGVGPDGREAHPS